MQINSVVRWGQNGGLSPSASDPRQRPSTQGLGNPTAKIIEHLAFPHENPLVSLFSHCLGLSLLSFWNTYM